MPRRGHPWYIGIFGSNWKNKGVALFLALVVWFLGYQNTEAEESFDGTVEIVAGKDLELISVRVAPTQGRSEGESRRLTIPMTVGVKLKLKGQKLALSKLPKERTLQQGHIIVVEDGILSLADAFPLPPGIAVESVDPAELEVKTDKQAIQSKTIKLVTTGLAPPPFVYKAARVEYNPQTVELVGPERVLEGPIEVPTLPYSIAEITKERTTVTLELDLERLPEGARLEKGQSNTVVVTIIMEKSLRVETKSVPVRYTYPSEPLFWARGDVPNVQLEVQGTPEQLQKWIEAVDDGRFYIMVGPRWDTPPGEVINAVIGDCTFPSDALFGVDVLSIVETTIDYRIHPISKKEQD